MAGRIRPEFIDELLARSDIVDLIGARVQLRKAGKDFQARCPFHDEKTPSFTVSREKQFYHCFGCGAHGTAIGFLMEHDRLAFREAVEELASQAGLEVPSEGEPATRGPDHGPLYDLLARAASLYRRQLREHPAAGRAVDYLKTRGLTGEVAARYGLGYAPPGWDFLMSALGTEPGDRERLLLCGLLAEQEGRRYDRFRERVMFPIRDRRGRVIGFGGRVLDDSKPKYLNSPETPVFHKGRELYGLFEAQRANRKPERLLVVEGYMDVIALAQFGIDFAVATLGTATTTEHLQQLARATPELVFCFDGDRAGRAAAWKALETALPQATGNQSLRFLFLPEGDDPDTLVRREGLGGFSARLQGAQPLSEFFFEHLADQVDMTSIDGRARLALLARPLLDRVPPGIYREMLENRLAAVAGLPPRGPAARQPRRRAALPRRPTRPTRIALAIALLLDRPDLAPEAAACAEDWRRMPNPGIEILAQLLETIAAYPIITKASLLERWRGHEHFDYLQRLSAEPFLADIPEDGAAAELTGAIDGLSAGVRDAESRRPLNQRSTADWSAEVREQMERDAERARTRQR